MTAAAAPHVFISYSTNDTTLVARLIVDLKQAGVAVWLDHEQLTPGTPNWTAAVRRGIEQATEVIYAASSDAADSEYVGHELAIARDEGKRTLPFWVCGETWSRCAPMGYIYHQYIDGRDAAYTAGIKALLDALGAAPMVAMAPVSPQPQPALQPQPVASVTLGAPRPSLLSMPSERFPERLLTLGYIAQVRDGVEWIIPPVCPVPAGKFRLGCDKTHDLNAQANELNRRIVDLAAFEMVRFPVTVAEYSCFRAATQRKEPQGRYNSLTWAQQLRRLDLPVVNISWYDAFDYAVWLTEHTGQPWRLPTEAEWEKAARCDPRDPLGGNSERIYPWGDRFDAARCNTRESGQRTRTPVGWYGPDDPDLRAERQSGASLYGVEELAGNVWEWLASGEADDYSKSQTAVSRDSTEYRRLHGGAWFNDAEIARATCRDYQRPGSSGDGVGFRLVRASPGG